MATPKQDIQKQAEPVYEESKTQASSSEGTKMQDSYIEELKKQAAAYDALKKQVDSYEELKKQGSLDEMKKQSTSYPEEIPYGSQLRTLRERVKLLASSPNSDVNEIAQCIKVITFFENQQARELAERRTEIQKAAVFFDNQSILQTSSVRKKEPGIIDTAIREPEFQRTNK